MTLKNYPQFLPAKRNVEDIEHVESINVADYVVLLTHLDKTIYA